MSAAASSDRCAIFEAVREAVAQICKAPLESLCDATGPTDIKGWDSFGRIQVVLEVERRLGRELPLKQAVEAGSIGAIVDVILAASP